MKLCCFQCKRAVSPLLCPVVVGDERGKDLAEVVDAADPAHAQLDEPIVGAEVVTWDQSSGAGARPARPMPTPKAPSAAAWARHRLTHMPFCAWCPICIATKRPNHHHRRYRHPDRLIPFIVADYGYARNSGEDMLVCIRSSTYTPFGLF